MSGHCAPPGGDVVDVDDDRCDDRCGAAGSVVPTIHVTASIKNDLGQEDDGQVAFGKHR